MNKLKINYNKVRENNEKLVIIYNKVGPSSPIAEGGLRGTIVWEGNPETVCKHVSKIKFQDKLEDTTYYPDFPQVSQPI